MTTAEPTLAPTMPTRKRDIRERDFYCPELRALLEHLPHTLTPEECKRIDELRVQAIKRYWPDAQARR